MLSRDAFLAFKDDRIGKVDVPLLGGQVCIATLTVADTDRVGALEAGLSPNVELVILGVCDEGGKRLFVDKDRDKLLAMPNDVIATIAKAIMAHNGYGPAGEAKNG